MQPKSDTILVSGGAGYIGSHVALALKQAGFTPVVIDSLVKGNRWAGEKSGPFRQGDIGDAAFVAAVCKEFQPVAALPARRHRDDHRDKRNTIYRKTPSRPEPGISKAGCRRSNNECQMKHGGIQGDGIRQISPIIHQINDDRHTRGGIERIGYTEKK